MHVLKVRHAIFNDIFEELRKAEFWDHDDGHLEIRVRNLVVFRNLVCTYAAE